MCGQIGAFDFGPRTEERSQWGGKYEPLHAWILYLISREPIKIFIVLGHQNSFSTEQFLDKTRLKWLKLRVKLKMLVNLLQNYW